MIAFGAAVLAGLIDFAQPLRRQGRLALLRAALALIDRLHRKSWAAGRPLPG